MGNKQDIRVTDETRVNLWLLLKDIKASGVHLAVVQGFDKSCFVHDGTSGRVDDNNAVLHLGEFRIADDVVGIFLAS